MKTRSQTSILLFVLVASALSSIPLVLHKTRQQADRTCHQNLQTLSTAISLYSCDWEGHYPSKLGLLTPNYLKSLPTCPLSLTDTYTSTYRQDVLGHSESPTFQGFIELDTGTPIFRIHCNSQHHLKATQWIGH